MRAQRRRHRRHGRRHRGVRTALPSGGPRTARSAARWPGGARRVPFGMPPCPCPTA